MRFCVTSQYHMDVVEKLAQAKGKDVDESEICYNKSHFREADRVIDSIKKLCQEIRHINKVELRNECDNIIDVFMEYQEQPGLLDPHLPDLIAPVMRLLSKEVHESRNSSDPGAFTYLPNMYFICRIVYALTIVRGFKIIMKHFPHEAADVEPVLLALERGGNVDSSPSNWHVRHLLLLWLSHLMLVPFTFDALDSSRAETAHLPECERPPPIRTRIVRLGQTFLSSASRVREAAAVLLGKVFGRADAHIGGAVEDFMTWCAEAVHGEHDLLNSDMPDVAMYSDKTPSINAVDATMRATGALHAIHEVIKRATRQASRPLLPTVYDRIVSRPPILAANSVHARRLRVKCCGRLALALLSPRLAKWRYSRGARSLALAPVSSTPSLANDQKTAIEEDEDDVKEENVPIEVEEILDILIQAVRDPDANVRWSAAKGVGRITARLPRKFAEEVAMACLECFEEREPDRSWHGGALAIAELMRRGLLLDATLDSSVGAIIRALQYKASSSSAHAASARDAACYACWSLARAFSLTQVQHLLPSLVEALILLALFDREVNCRRAAAAALQELVGRLGGIANGIAIVRTLDFFAIGSVTSCFGKVAVEAATLGHLRSMAAFLLKYSIRHTTFAIRIQASKCLGRLVRLAVSQAENSSEGESMRAAAEERLAFFAAQLPMIAESCLDINVETRHGALHAIAHLIRALPGKYVPSEAQDATRSVVVQVEKARLYTGKGGESVREGVCAVAAALAESNWNFKPVTSNRLLKSVLESATHLSANVQLCARDALSRLAHHRLEDSSCEELLANLLSGLKQKSGVNVAARRGFANALGAIPVFKVSPKKIEEAIEALSLEAMDKLHPGKSGAELRDAETRVNSLLSLAILLDALKAASLPQSHLHDKYESSYEFAKQQVISACTVAMSDRQVDRRGDVGSWVRETAVEVAALVLESHEGDLNMLKGIVALAGDRLNRTRGRSLFLLHRLYVASPACTGKYPGSERRPLRAGFIFRRVHFKVAYGTNMAFGKAFAGSDENVDETVDVGAAAALEGGRSAELEWAGVDGTQILDNTNLDPALLAASVLNDEIYDRSKLPLAEFVSSVLSKVQLSVPRSLTSAYGATETEHTTTAIYSQKTGSTLATLIPDATIDSFSAHPVPWTNIDIIPAVSKLLVAAPLMESAIDSWAATAGGSSDTISRLILKSIIMILCREGSLAIPMCLDEKHKDANISSLACEALTKQLQKTLPQSLSLRLAELTSRDTTLPWGETSTSIPQSIEAISKVPVAAYINTVAAIADEGRISSLDQTQLMLYLSICHGMASTDTLRARSLISLAGALSSNEPWISKNGKRGAFISSVALIVLIRMLKHAYPSVRAFAAQLIRSNFILSSGQTNLPLCLNIAFESESAADIAAISSCWKEMTSAIDANEWNAEVIDDIEDLWVTIEGLERLLTMLRRAGKDFNSVFEADFSLLGTCIGLSDEYSLGDKTGSLLGLLECWRMEKIALLDDKKKNKQDNGFGYGDLLRAEHSGMF